MLFDLEILIFFWIKKKINLVRKFQKMVILLSIIRKYRLTFTFLKFSPISIFSLSFFIYFILQVFYYDIPNTYYNPNIYLLIIHQGEFQTCPLIFGYNNRGYFETAVHYRIKQRIALRINESNFFSGCSSFLVLLFVLLYDSFPCDLAAMLPRFYQMSLHLRRCIAFQH